MLKVYNNNMAPEIVNDISLGIRQKGKSQNECFKKAKHAKISEKQTFLTPPDTHTHMCVLGGKKCLFFGNFGVLCFLETPVLIFALLHYYQRFSNRELCLTK